MKKITLILFLLFFLINNLAGSLLDDILWKYIGTKKTNVFHGYQKVKWRSSLETVKKHYPKLKKEPLDVNGLTYYYQVHPNNIIKLRSFFFYEDKLFKVGVDFIKELKDSVVEVIYKRIFEKFGIHHDTSNLTSMVWYFNNKRMMVKLAPCVILNSCFCENDCPEYIEYMDTLLLIKMVDHQKQKETENIGDF